MNGEGNELRLAVVRNLTALGLSEYAARTLVALTEIGAGSAREVSEASSVPRTRVYDAVEELAARGFVRIRESHPKEFVSASPPRIRRAFYREYVYREAVAEWGLRTLRQSDGTTQSRDVAVRSGGEAVQERFLETIRAVEERLSFVSIGRKPSPETLACLDAVCGDDVDVRVLLGGQVAPATVREAVPGATVLTAPQTTTVPADRSRFVVVDESLAAMTVRHEADEATEVGLFTERPGLDVTVLLQQVVDAWLTDVS